MNLVEKYFNAEWLECVLGIIVGLASLGLGVYFLLVQDSDFYNGLAYVFLLMALVEFIVCITVVIRSPKDIIRVNSYIPNDKIKIQTEEIPRMQTVLKNFVVYRYGEIFLLVLGLILFFVFSDESVWKGIGAGLIVQSIILLIFDFFAEKRGKVYIKFLQQI